MVNLHGFYCYMWWCWCLCGFVWNEKRIWWQNCEWNLMWDRFQIIISMAWFDLYNDSALWILKSARIQVKNSCIDPNDTPWNDETTTTSSLTNILSLCEMRYVKWEVNPVPRMSHTRFSFSAYRHHKMYNWINAEKVIWSRTWFIDFFPLFGCFHRLFLNYFLLCRTSKMTPSRSNRPSINQA